MRTTAVVTGATAGIGRAFADALAAEHELVLVARDATRLEDVATQLRARHGGQVRVLAADLATPDGVRAVAEVLTDPASRLGLLVNNAGHGLRRSFADSPLVEEDALLDVLVRAPMHLSHAALQTFLATSHPGGAVVNVSSVAGFLPRGTYGAHKAWVTSFSRWADLEYRDRGVRFLALCPGFVRTEFHQRMDARTDAIPGWMWLDAADLVAAALADLREGKSLSVPSRRYQVLAATARFAPQALVHRVARLGR